MEPRRILFLSVDGMTDVLGQSQVLPYLEGLASAGFPITVISCEKPKAFKQNHTVVENICATHKIEWQALPYTAGVPVLSQFSNFSRLKKAAVAWAKSNPSPIIHCRSYLPGLVGLHLKKKYGAQFLFDMRGFWADERLEGGIWKIRNPIHAALYRFFKRKERELIGNADAIVALTHAARKYITETFHPKAPIHVIPCCADIRHFQVHPAADRYAMRERLGIDRSKFVFGYLGSLGTWYMLDEMLDLFKTQLRYDPHAVFFFVTTDEPELIFAKAQEKNIPKSNIRVSAASRAEVPNMISVFDAGVFFIRPSFSKTASSPTKLAEILACGVPVVTNTGIGDVDDLVSRYKGGVLVHNFSAEEYEKVRNELQRLALQAPDHYRNICLEHFSLTKGIEEYKKIYNELKLTKP